MTHTDSPTASFYTAATIYNRDKGVDQPRKKPNNKKQQCASHINKAEDGYDVGTHAVEKHPVNILRLKTRSPCKAKHDWLS